MRTAPHTFLEFNLILERLSSHGISEAAKEKALTLTPFLSERECRLRMLETTEARKIIEGVGAAPLAPMQALRKTMVLAAKGDMLIPEQLTGITTFIATCRRMQGYLKKAEGLNVGLAAYGGSFHELPLLYEEIDRAVRGGMIDSNASAPLRDIRRKIEHAHTAIKAKLESLLKSKKECFADGYVATRSGRFVLPVRKEYKNQISGTVIDTSGSGGTCFIEPSAVRRLQEELALLQIDEENEVRKILYTLTALVDDHAAPLKINIECMESLDFIFAKAKLSLELKAIAVPITPQRSIKIIAGRHPLLPQDSCVPLDFEIGGRVNGVIITGPNTGGKTVALKTVGLLSLMAQCGLHVPAGEGSVFSMHANILSDIGDGQSITENLSTFSSHLINIIAILKSATDESLVLLDELGSGTDPAEGMGLAVAILDELKNRGCLFVATTHYPEIKEYAKNTDKLVNARMAFDRESLQPLYQLEIGEAGESCALYIARRLGFPEPLLKRAYAEAYGEKGTAATAAPPMAFAAGSSLAPAMAPRKIIKDLPERAAPLQGNAFNVGDSVTVYPQKSIGIVYRPANEKGELCVQIKGEKQMINHKRIKLLTPANELYPDNYDFSIIFDSVADRKASHTMARKHSPNLVIVHEEGEK